MKFLDLAGVEYLWGKIKAKFVAKEAGKGLSTNDLTTALKGNYDKAYTHSTTAHAPAGAQANVIESVKVNGTALTTTSKAVDVTVPTKVSQLTNDSGFLNAVPSTYKTKTENDTYYQPKGSYLTSVPTDYKTKTENDTLYQPKGSYLTSIPAEYVTDTKLTAKGYQTSAQVSSAITSAIANITSFDFSVVTDLPATGKKGVIYLKSNSGSGQNVYDEFIWVNSKYELLGTTQMDLSGYMKKTDATEVTNAEIDTICV